MTILLGVFWYKDGAGQNRSTRYGEVTMDVGECPVPELTNREMQDIAFAAKMEFARRMRARKRKKSPAPAGESERSDG